MKKRLISAAIMLALFIIFYLLGGKFFIALISFISIFAYKEIAFLKKYPGIIILLGFISFLTIILLNSLGFVYVAGMKYASVLLPFIILIMPSLLPSFHKSYTLEDAFSFIAKLLFVGLSFSAMNILMLSKKELFLYVVIIAILNDSFAYFFGRLLGKTKFSKISPNKSVEGLIFGNLFGITGGLLFYLIFISSTNILYAVIVTILLNISCQVGDLIYSKIKREHDIKDFSNIIPGHGGILDRLDSMLFCSLVYLFILTIM